MHILCVGISHRTAPVELREKIAMNEEAAAEALRELAELYDGTELSILSTCNRTEVYAARPLHAHPRVDEVIAYLADRFDVPTEALGPAIYHHDNERAVRHLMRVASGLDSMVLGEEQILGQVRQAYARSTEAGAAGPMLHKLFQSALAVGKKIRNETGLSAGRTSVAAVAVDFARHLFRAFDDKTVLTIGAGEMTELALRHFAELRPRRVLVCNRSIEKARELAETCGGETAPFESLDEHLVAADVVISSTGSKRPIVTAERFRPLLKRRRFRPLFLIDIAMPRDIDPVVGELANVYLYDLDDLQKAVADHAVTRSGEVGAAEALIEPAVAECYASAQTGDFNELIRKLREKLHAYGEDEARRTANKLGGAASEDKVREALDELTHRLINKILHRPLSELNRDPGGASAAMYATALRRLFELGEGPDACEADDADASAP